MTVRPIIFSGAMVKALLDGRKTQTRRLITSPLARCEIGDLLYVREAFAFVGGGDPGLFITRADYPACVPAGVENLASERDVAWRPSIHMRRDCSRLTLEVTDRRAQRLDWIDEADAKAEGATKRERCSGFNEMYDGWCMDWDRIGQPGFDGKPLRAADICLVNARSAFLNFWTTLHGDTDDWPDIVALTFKVHKVNVDKMEAAA